MLEYPIVSSEREQYSEERFRWLVADQRTHELHRLFRYGLERHLQSQAKEQAVSAASVIMVVLGAGTLGLSLLSKETLPLSALSVALLSFPVVRGIVKGSQASWLERQLRIVADELGNRLDRRISDGADRTSRYYPRWIDRPYDKSVDLELSESPPPLTPPKTWTARLRFWR